MTGPQARGKGNNGAVIAALVGAGVASVALLATTVYLGMSLLKGTETPSKPTGLNLAALPTPVFTPSPSTARPEPDFAAKARESASAPARDDGPGRSLTTADVVAESDASIALVKGRTSSGTGFLVGPGLIATNSHVIDDEFINNLEIRFPSAPAARKGPVPAELLYEDSHRDLALLAVKTDLPPLRVARSYTFRKGEEITVIGSPGIGDGVVLENAISRGVMSTRATLEGQNFYQLGIAVNPGNSGGPVFDSSGRVIGVVTLKTEKQEALAFCVPIEDLQSALASLASQTTAQAEKVRSRHRVINAVKGLGSGGALYCIGIEIRARPRRGLWSTPSRRRRAKNSRKPSSSSTVFCSRRSAPRFPVYGTTR